MSKICLTENNDNTSASSSGNPSTSDEFPNDNQDDNILCNQLEKLLHEILNLRRSAMEGISEDSTSSTPQDECTGSYNEEEPTHEKKRVVGRKAKVALCDTGSSRT